MNELERMVWAAAFAIEHAREYQFRLQYHHTKVEDILGFSCGEIADEALRKFRQAMTCDDAQYLYPIEEEWYIERKEK